MNIVVNLDIYIPNNQMLKSFLELDPEAPTFLIQSFEIADPPNYDIYN